MTTTDPAPLSSQDTTDNPTALTEQLLATSETRAKEHNRPPLLVLTALVALVLVGTGICVAVARNTPTSTSTEVTDGTGLSVCDSDLVQVYPMINGVALRITAPGPTVVGVDVWDTYTHRRLIQQVTKNNNEAEFAMWDITGIFHRVTVGIRGVGSCNVSAAIIDQLNR